MRVAGGLAVADPRCQVIVLPQAAAERALFDGCRDKESAIAELLERLELAGALTATHTRVLLMFGGRGHRPEPDSTAGKIWRGAMTTVTPAMRSAGLI